MAKWNKGKYIQAQYKASSKWEKELDDVLFKFDSWASQPKQYVKYTIHKTYTPDNVSLFLLSNGTEIIVEKKGRFRDRDDATRYSWVREALRDDQELIFVFYDPKKAFPHARKRKDGTKQTHSDWAESNNFRWYTDDYLIHLRKTKFESDEDMWNHLILGENNE